MPGQLFTHYFLTDGIKATAEWKASVARPEEFAAFKHGVSSTGTMPSAVPQTPTK